MGRRILFITEFSSWNFKQATLYTDRHCLGDSLDFPQSLKRSRSDGIGRLRKTSADARAFCETLRVVPGGHDSTLIPASDRIAPASPCVSLRSTMNPGNKKRNGRAINEIDPFAIA